MSTPSEPSGASGQHPPYPIGMGLFLIRYIDFNLWSNMFYSIFKIEKLM